MADIEYSDAVGGEYPPAGVGMSKVINGLGALISVSLVAGLAWWGYQLMVRDVTGVPVIRALEGPMRVAPDDPGGEAADYQGLAVNNIPAEGEAAPPADQVVLAPPPTSLRREDLPVRDLQIIASAQSGQEAGEKPASEAPEAAARATPQAAPESPEAGARPPAAAAEATPHDGQPHAAEAAEVAPADQASPLDQAALIEAVVREAIGADTTPAGGVREVAAAITPIPADIPGVKRSRRPVPRPASILVSDPAQAAAVPAGESVDAAVVEAALAPAPAASEPDLRIVDPTTLTVGTRLAQLGAFATPELAEGEWARVSALFPDIMEGKGRVIQEGQSGGRVFYRLRAEGFENLSDVRRFCAALLTGDASCIPVTIQ